jgi:hypothetical protein
MGEQKSPDVGTFLSQELPNYHKLALEWAKRLDNLLIFSMFLSSHLGMVLAYR